MHYDPYTAALTRSSSLLNMSTQAKIVAMTAAEEAFEREKAAITSYEEGWDRWDGPVWPIGYVQCRMRRSFAP